MSLDVAAVNATLLALIIGGGIAYSVVVVQRRRELELRLLEAAEAINRVFFRGSADNKTIALRLEFDPRKDEERGKLLWNLISVPVRMAGESSAERAAHILAHLTVILGDYPFPTSVIREGQDVSALAPPQPLRFRDVAEVRTWLRALEGVLGHLRVLEGSPAELQSLFNALHEESEWGESFVRGFEEFPEPYRSDIEARLGHFDVRRVPDRLFSAAGRAGEVASRVNSALRRLDRQEMRLPTRTSLILASSWVAVVFASGVLLPMWWANTPWMIHSAFPAVSYAVAIVAVIFRLVKSHARPDME